MRLLTPFHPPSCVTQSLAPAILNPAILTPILAQDDADEGTTGTMAGIAQEGPPDDEEEQPPVEDDLAATLAKLHAVQAQVSWQGD